MAVTQPLPPAAPSQLPPPTRHFMALWEQMRDLTYITVESGRVAGEACRCTRLQQWLAGLEGGCPRSVLLWWEVGGQQGLGCSD